MSHNLFEDTTHVISWKRPDAKFVVSGSGFDGTIQAWEGPGDPPTAETIEGWKAEFVADDIGNDLEAESKINEAELAGMYAVFEVTTGSPPTDEEKAALYNSMKANLIEVES
tara:strand:- start:240 stop:575 length:336 start_codon:yes stop_codon:yes gene_type:complete